MNTHLTLDQVSRATRTLAIVTTLSLLAGCAGVTITNDNKDAKPGIPVRMPEPYLLVTLPLEEGKPAQAQIIALPTGEKIRLEPKGGLGSASLKFELTNGALSSWGLDTDSKVPETITAVSGLATGLLGALDDEEAAATESTATPKFFRANVADRSVAQKEMASRLEGLQDALRKFAKDPTDLFSTKTQIELLKALPGEVEQLKDLLLESNPTSKKITAQIDLILLQTADLKSVRSEPIAITYEAWRLNARAILADVRTAFETPAPSTPPETFRLFRIKQDKTGGVKLERVR